MGLNVTQEVVALRRMTVPDLRRRVWSAVPSAPLWLEPRRACKAKAAKAAASPPHSMERHGP